MTTGSLSLVLHAHLPFVRHPEHPSFLEEDWLFEAITETYVPLLRMLDRLAADEVAVQLTMSMSPPLCEMLVDPLLQERYARRLNGLIRVAQREAMRRRFSPFQEAAEFYVAELKEVREIWADRYGRNLLRGFRGHQDAGRLCLVTVGGTHGYLPLMATDMSRSAAVEIAATNYDKHFGRRPEGIWLPECAYAPGLDQVLADAGLRFFFMETHGVNWARPKPKFGTLRPVFTESGVAAFARDPECSRQVWSAKEGYPGDPLYREFYRDLGWQAPDEVIGDLLGGGPRRGVGLKYHRISGEVPLDEKEPYVPSWARERATIHAADFLANRQAQAAHLAETMEAEPHMVAPFDAELFGHWWFEGPAFLEAFFRVAAEQDTLGVTTPARWLVDNPVAQVVQPIASSWGDRGSYDVWLNADNAWMYQHLHRAEERMVELADRFTAPNDLEQRALAQCARELLLAQASDWAFIVTMKTVVPYANKRTRVHMDRFHRLYGMLIAGAIDGAALSEWEGHDTIFPEVDPSLYRSERVKRPNAGAAVATVR